MPSVHAIAAGVTSAEGADQVQFFSELDFQPATKSLSGLSGGPVFWSDGERFGLIGFIKQALDLTPKPGEETIYSRPRVNFIVQRADYETFAGWAKYTLKEWPKRRQALNNALTAAQAALSKPLPGVSE